MTFVTALIHQEGPDFGISFPDFPGCISTGGSMDDVIARGEQALRLHVEGMIEDGEPLPRLRSPGEAAASLSAEELAGGVLYAMDFDVAPPVVRINVSLPESLLKQIDRAAGHSGVSRSAFLAEAARARLKGAA